MAYNSVINTEANRSSESDLSVLDSKVSIYDKGSGRNIGTPATRLDITAATTENIVSFIIAFILLSFTDMEVVHINFGDKELLIIAERSEIDDYFSCAIQSNQAKCVPGMLGREIVFAQ